MADSQDSITKVRLSRRRLRRLAIVFLIPVLMLFIAISGIYLWTNIFLWSELNCRHEDVDIKTGRIRHTRYLLYCRVDEKVEDSILTNALPREAVDGVQPDWRRVNTFSPGVRHSPHYAYHGAFSQIHHLQIIWTMVPFSDEAKRYVAEQVLRIWQSSGSYFRADDYIHRVFEMASKAHERSRREVTPEDLSAETPERVPPSPRSIPASRDG